MSRQCRSAQSGPWALPARRGKPHVIRQLRMGEVAADLKAEQARWRGCRTGLTGGRGRLPRRKGSPTARSRAGSSVPSALHGPSTAAAGSAENPGRDSPPHRPPLTEDRRRHSVAAWSNDTHGPIAQDCSTRATAVGEAAGAEEQTPRHPARCFAGTHNSPLNTGRLQTRQGQTITARRVVTVAVRPFPQHTAPNQNSLLSGSLTVRKCIPRPLSKGSARR